MNTNKSFCRKPEGISPYWRQFDTKPKNPSFGYSSSGSTYSSCSGSTYSLRESGSTPSSYHIPSFTQRGCSGLKTW